MMVWGMKIIRRKKKKRHEKCYDKHSKRLQLKNIYPCMLHYIQVKKSGEASSSMKVKSLVSGIKQLKQKKSKV